MTTLYYCETHYNAIPIVDINPLILEKNKGKEILVLCAREGSIIRIKDFMLRNPENKITPVGWWEFSKKKLLQGFSLNLKKIYSYDAVVIIGRSRIDSRFERLVTSVERILDVYSFSRKDR